MFETVRKVLAEQLEVDPAMITMETGIIDDLGADSLDLVELVMSLEEHYDIVLTDDKTANERTVDRCPLAHGTKRPADVREAIEQRDQANLQDTDIHKFSLLISILGFTAKAVPPLVSELRERSSGVGPAVYFNSFLTSSFASDGTIWQ